MLMVFGSGTTSSTTREEHPWRFRYNGRMQIIYTKDELSPQQAPLLVK